MSWCGVWARTDEEAPRVGIFVVQAGAHGMRIEETWRQLGMRASGSHDVIFDDVRVPLDHAAELKTPAERAAPDALQTAWSCVVFSTVYDGAARAGVVPYVDYLDPFVHAAVVNVDDMPAAKREDYVDSLVF